MSKLTESDLGHAKKLLEDEGPASMYEYLGSKGDRYSKLAAGVVELKSISGIAASSYMHSVAGREGRQLSKADVESIMRTMAKHYLDDTGLRLKDGVVDREIDHLAAAAFHSETFKGHGLPDEAWTLYPVLEVLTKQGRAAYWEKVLDAAGDPVKEGLLTVDTTMMMSSASAMAPEPQRQLAREFIDTFDSPSGLMSMVATASSKWFESLIDWLPSFNVETPPVEADLQLQINTTPAPRQEILDEDRIRNDVSNGFIQNRATHSIAFSDGTLDKTDFTSAQVGSIATGGIRPGELQPDPNVQPSSHLSQFYRDGNESGSPDFSLRNAVVLGGLSAQTVVNTFVDPLLLDLTGNGAGMTAISDGVLFDVDNSGSLRRTGWADAHTGMLVREDGSGIRNISQLFSEYYGGQAGVDGGSGQRPHKDGFAALASEDGNQDGAINAQDSIWSQLRVWVDANQDGRAEGAELKTPDELGITAIRVDQVTPLAEQRQGNQVLARGTFTREGVEREILAVNFLSDSVSNRITPQPGGNIIDVDVGRHDNPGVRQPEHDKRGARRGNPGRYQPVRWQRRRCTHGGCGWQLASGRAGQQYLRRRRRRRCLRHQRH